MRIIIIILIILGFNLSFKAQLLDSIRSSFRYNPKLFIKLDARNSFISSSHIRFQGLKAGLNFNNTTKIGLGYSWLSSDYRTLHNNDTIDLQIKCVSAFIEYNFFRSKHIYADIPVQIGLANVSYFNKEDVLINTLAVLYEPSMTIEYRFIRFFGICFGAGYRLVLYNNKNIKDRLSSPIYIIRFKVCFGDIYKQHIKKDSRS